MARISPSIAEVIVNQNGHTQRVPLGRFTNDTQPSVAKVWIRVVPHPKPNEVHALLGHPLTWRIDVGPVFVSVDHTIPLHFTQK